MRALTSALDTGGTRGAIQGTVHEGIERGAKCCTGHKVLHDIALVQADAIVQAEHLHFEDVAELKRLLRVEVVLHKNGKRNVAIVQGVNRKHARVNRKRVGHDGQAQRGFQVDTRAETSKDTIMRLHRKSPAFTPRRKSVRKKAYGTGILRRRVTCGPAFGGPRSDGTARLRVMGRIAALHARFPQAGVLADLAAVRTAFPTVAPLTRDAAQLVSGSRAINTADHAIRAYLAFARWVAEVTGGGSAGMPPRETAIAAYALHVRWLAAQTGTPSSVRTALNGIRFVCERVFGVPVRTPCVALWARQENVRALARPVRRARALRETEVLDIIAHDEWGGSRDPMRRILALNVAGLYSSGSRWNDWIYMDLQRSLCDPTAGMPTNTTMRLVYKRTKTTGVVLTPKDLPRVAGDVLDMYTILLDLRRDLELVHRTDVLLPQFVLGRPGHRSWVEGTAGSGSAERNTLQSAYREMLDDVGVQAGAGADLRTIHGARRGRLNDMKAQGLNEDARLHIGLWKTVTSMRRYEAEDSMEAVMSEMARGKRRRGDAERVGADEVSTPSPAKRQKTYLCSRCRRPKKGHICPFRV